MAKTKEQLFDFKAWYAAVGFSLGRLSGREYVSECPACAKPKWHVNKDTGQHHCKRCGLKGNHYTFMQWMLDQGDTEGLEEVAEERGLSEEVLQEIGIFRLNGEWWLPIYNNGKIVTVRKWVPPVKGKSGAKIKSGILYNLPKVGVEGTFLYHVYNPENIGKVVVCEGPWDAIALYDAAKAHYKDKPIPFCIWAVPSANILRPRWLNQFGNKTVYLAYDNDKPGKDGMHEAVKTLRDHCSEVHPIRWPSKYPDKFDVRDLVKKEGEKTLPILWSLFDHHEVQKEQPIRTKYSEVMEDLKRFKVKTNEQFLDIFDCMLATAFVSHLEGDPVWLFIVAAPGAGKTTLTNMLLGCEHTYHISKVTATQLVSGRNSKSGQDPSLIPRLNNLTLIIKDYTEIIDMGGGEQAELLSVLRGAYDRTLVRDYGTGISRRYTSKFSIVAGVTGKIYQTTQASLGERFLRIHLDPMSGKDTDAQILAAMEAAQDRPDLGMQLAPYVSAYLNYLKDTVDCPPRLTKAQQLKIAPIVKVVAHFRTATALGREREDLEAPPDIETGSRTAVQLQKLATGLAVIHQKKTVDEHIFNKIRRVARDTCRGYYQDMVRLCAENPQGLTVKEFGQVLSLANSPIRRKLAVLKQLEMLKQVPVKDGRSGRPEERWQLHPKFAPIWKKAEI